MLLSTKDLSILCKVVDLELHQSVILINAHLVNEGKTGAVVLSISGCMKSISYVRFFILYY